MPTPFVLVRVAPRARAFQPLAAAASLLLLAATSARAAGPQDRRLTNTRTGLSVEAPAGWTLSQHTGYGDTVVLLLHPNGSRISVTAARTPARDAATLFEQNRPGLLAEGLAPSAVSHGPRGSLAIDLTRRGQSDRVRQLYLVREIPGGRQAVVLTLICRADSLAAHSSALDFVATRLGLDDPAAPAGSSRPDYPPKGSGGRDLRGGEGGHNGQGGFGGEDRRDALGDRGGPGGHGGQDGQSDRSRSGGQARAPD